MKGTLKIMYCVEINIVQNIKIVGDSPFGPDHKQILSHFFILKSYVLILKTDFIPLRGVSKMHFLPDYFVTEQQQAVSRNGDFCS